MKKNRGMAFFLVSAIAFSSLSFSVNALDQVGSEEQEILGVFDDLVHYASEGDQEGFLRLTKDLRWPDAKMQSENTDLDEELLSFEVVRLSKLKKDYYLAEVKHQTGLMEKEMTVEMPVLKDKGEWKIVIGQDYE